MNDRFTPDKDRLVHKADENDDRTVRKFDEDDLNASRHDRDVTYGLQEPRHGDADHADTSPSDPDTGTRDPLAGDRDDVLVVEPDDDRRVFGTTTGSDAPLDDKRRDVPGELDDDGRSDRNDSPFAHAQTPVTPPVTPADTATFGAPVPGKDSPVTPGFPENTSDRPDDVLDEDAGFTPTERTEQTPAATAPATAGVLFDQDSDDVRRRWQEVQAGFVDDPRDAVERADSLLDEVTSSLRNTLEARTNELQGRWKNTEKNDTEDLRTALRDYRATLEQLLNISAGTR